MNRAFHVGGIVCFVTALLMGSGTVPWLPALFLVLALAALLVKRKLPLWAYASATAFCLCAVSVTLWQEAELARSMAFAGTTQELRGVVVEKVLYPEYAYLTIQNDAQGLPDGLAGVRVRVGTQDALEAEVGNVVNYKAALDCPEQERIRLFSRGLRFKGYLNGERLRVTGEAAGFFAAVARYRAGMQSNLRRLLIGPEGDTLICMLTADGTAISPDLRESYARAGAAHLLSVSGLHLSVLVGLLTVLLRRLRLSRKERAVVAIASVLLFLALTGFPYSLIRSGIMLSVSSAAVLLGRDDDPLNSLGFAAVLILLWNPYAAFSVSFQLSYLSTMGIAAFATPLSNTVCKYLTGKTLCAQTAYYPSATGMLEAACVSVCASTAVLPLVCWNFGQFSLVALPVNLMVGPAITVLLAAGMLCGISGFFPGLSVVYRASGLVAGAVMRMVNDVVERWAALPFSALPLRADSAIFWMGAVLTGGWALCSLRVSASVRRYAAACMILPLLASQLVHAAAWGDTIVMAVPNRGSAVVLAYGKQAAVIGEPSSLRETRGICAFLRDHGAKRVALLVLPKQKAVDATPTAELLKAFPPDHTVALDGEQARFEARLFGRAYLLSRGDGAVQIDLDGTRVIKLFQNRTVRTDLLINSANELIFAPGSERGVNDRYFDSAVVTFRARPLEQGYRPNNKLEAKANEIYRGERFFQAREKP